uniref:Enhancer of yellow 2 transcription factor n=1 Tax=Panstrongylus megistus TaxID=65343 RepID=A0A069DNX7_9HEMI
MPLDSGSEHLGVLRATGEYDRLKDLLRSRLYECGWVDQIHMLCRQSRKTPNPTVNEMYAEVAKKGRGLVPASIKRELLLRVKEHLLTTAGYYDDDTTQPQGEK